MVIQQFIRKTAMALCALTITAALSGHARAQDTTCPIPGQKPTLVFQLYFGQSVKNRGPVTAKEWKDFLVKTVTPRFPAGFTVHDAYGQWLNAEIHKVIGEKTKVIVIATEDTAQARTSIAEIADAFRTLYHQESVAIVSNAGCSVF
jgi:hypothetical protein